MKKHTFMQSILVFTICIALTLTGGITAAAEDDWVDPDMNYYYSPDGTDSNMLPSVTVKDETTGESWKETVFHAYDGMNNVFYVYLDKGSASSMELLTAENEPSEEDKWWEEAKALRIEPWDVENPMMKSIDEQNEFIKVEPVDNKDGWYKISVQDKVKDHFGLSLSIRTVCTNSYTDEEDQVQTDSWVNDKYVTILYHESTLAVVNENNPNDFSCFLSGEPGIPFTFQLQQLNTANGKVSFDKISSPDALDVLISTSEDDWAEGQEHIEKADPATYTLTATDGIFSFTSKEEGKYYLTAKDSYAVESTDPSVATALPENAIQVDVWMPSFSFHSAADTEQSADTWLGYDTTYKEAQTSTIYALVYLDENDPWAFDPDSIDFAAYNSGHEKLSDYISVEKVADTEDPCIYRITLTDKATGDFTISGTAKYNGYGNAEDPGLSELQTVDLSVKSMLTDIRIKTAPAKTTYQEGESFDKTGLVVEAVYNDQSSYAITNYTINAPAKFAVNDKEVSISWHGKTIKQSVTVNAKAAPSQPSATAKPKAKVGDTSVANGNTYQITAVSPTKKEAALKAGNKNAKKVSIPSSITINGTSYKVVKIGNNAFKNSKKLTKITVSKNVTSIGKNAFSGCKKLKNITIKSTKLKSIGKNAFKGISKKSTIKVPKNKKKAYSKLLKKAGFKGKIK